MGKFRKHISVGHFGTSAQSKKMYLTWWGVALSMVGSILDIAHLFTFERLLLDLKIRNPPMDWLNCISLMSQWWKEMYGRLSYRAFLSQFFFYKFNSWDGDGNGKSEMWRWKLYMKCGSGNCTSEMYQMMEIGSCISDMYQKMEKIYLKCIRK